ncbi:hypothetical protein BK022_24290 [Methylorubrum extorquens]|uniref:Uncharacterized protein n=1 Tax=Methylorubrum extorquens TaxID=408 RepID=A0A1S1P2B7_METEX|nr:hypothetical protein BK022_24290 [Methylorubrum extorquens]
MPDHDGGHYFLTVLAPIRTDLIVSQTPGQSHSHLHRLGQKLALLPTGQQTAAPLPPGTWKPKFTRNTQNHFARFVIIPGPAYNGRLSGDTLLGVLRNEDPLKPQVVDRLRTPYLLFGADIDAQGDADAALRTYTDTLWATMQDDLEVIFGHCEGFDGIDTAGKFHGYIRKCQVETTMPFNDYWSGGFPVGSRAIPIAPLKWAGNVAVIVLVIWLTALLLNGAFSALGAENAAALWAAKLAAWGAIVIPLMVALAVTVAYGALRWMWNKAQMPLPTAPGSDLPTILKSLYLQQHFTRFAIEAQGLSAAQLHTRFGAFLAAVQPAEATPTQPPGEVRAPDVEWTR